MEARLSNRKMEKIPNYTIWNLIQYTQDMLNLRINLFKVKAHDEDILNDQADFLAKTGRDLPPIMPNITGIGSRNLIILLDHIPIESSIRKFYKDFFSAKSFGDFLTLSHNKLMRLMTINSTID